MNLQQFVDTKDRCHRAVDIAFAKMAEANVETTAEKILDVLERQTFYEWYEKEFAEYIQDTDENLSRAEHKEKVLAKIRELFGVT